MQAILDQSAKPYSFPRNWKKEESVYTGDDLIDAYLKGKQAARGEAVNILINQLKENVGLAASVCEKLFSTAEKKKIHFNGIHLKADSLTTFSALFVAKKDDFISDKFRDVLISARKIKNEAEKDSFYISFSFMPESKSINENCLKADGFFLKYDTK